VYLFTEKVDQILPRGTHKFPFKFQLPESSLPCSFESKPGTIRYYIKVSSTSLYFTIYLHIMVMGRAIPSKTLLFPKMHFLPLWCLLHRIEDNSIPSVLPHWKLMDPFWNTFTFVPFHGHLNNFSPHSSVSNIISQNLDYFLCAWWLSSSTIPVSWKRRYITGD